MMIERFLNRSKKIIIVLVFASLIGCQATPVTEVGHAIMTIDSIAYLSGEELNSIVGPLGTDGKPLPYNPNQACEAEQRIYMATAGMLGTVVELNKALVRGLASVYVDPNQKINISICVRNPYWIPPKSPTN